MDSKSKAQGESTPLKVVVFMGSARNSPAAWGGPARLGSRVLKFVTNTLESPPEAVDSKFQVLSVLDPAELQWPVVDKPHFFYKKGEAPDYLEEHADMIASADCFVLVTYLILSLITHTLALQKLMNYFGGSKYSWKPSAIIAYSNGQYGGMRAAMSLRAFTAELGCLSVSNICGIPFAEKEFNEEGVPNDKTAWDRRISRTLNQLQWYGHALRNHRNIKGVPA